VSHSVNHHKKIPKFCAWVDAARWGHRALPFLRACNCKWFRQRAPKQAGKAARAPIYYLKELEVL